jgi:ABC-type branched-subunit amino acid transport system ATPase component
VEVASGLVASIVGPNGSGKSTLLKALSGVLRPSSGRVLISDRDITGLAPEEIARAGIGYVPQVDDVFAPLTVRENLEMGGYLLPSREIGARVERVLAVFPRLGGMLTRRAGRLSGGERKMLAMGRVLMLEPAVFLLDEPTANLAPKIAAELLSEHVRALAARSSPGSAVDGAPGSSAGGAAVLVVEQRARAVLAISDYTYVLGGGQVVMEGSPAELSSSPDFIASFLGGRDPARGLDRPFRARDREAERRGQRDALRVLARRQHLVCRFVPEPVQRPLGAFLIDEQVQRNSGLRVLHGLDHPVVVHGVGGRG